MIKALADIVNNLTLIWAVIYVINNKEDNAEPLH